MGKVEKESTGHHCKSKIFVAQVLDVLDLIFSIALKALIVRWGRSRRQDHIWLVTATQEAL
jgi:hypothetical protein